MNRRGKTAKKFAGEKGSFFTLLDGAAALIIRLPLDLRPLKRRKERGRRLISLLSTPRPPLRLRTKVPSIPFNPLFAPLGLIFGKGKPGQGFF